MKSYLGRVLMYCSTCWPTHTSSFTLWHPSEGFFVCLSITNNCNHFKTWLQGWCSVRAPAGWADVPPQGAMWGCLWHPWPHRAFWTLEETVAEVGHVCCSWPPSTLRGRCGWQCWGAKERGQQMAVSAPDWWHQSIGWPTLCVLANIWEYLWVLGVCLRHQVLWCFAVRQGQRRELGNHQLQEVQQG